MKIKIALHVKCVCNGPLIAGECDNCDARSFKCGNCGMVVDTCDCYGGVQSDQGSHIMKTTKIDLPPCDCPDCKGQKEPKKLRGIVGDFDSRMN